MVVAKLHFLCSNVVFRTFVSLDNELAAFFHGKTETVVYENGTEADVTLSGSCVGRMPDCGNSYWAQAVLATMTQTRGMKTGSLLDPSNFDPLLGPAMEETLRLLGEQTLYGPADEFDGCVGINVDHMNQGKVRSMLSYVLSCSHC